MNNNKTALAPRLRFPEFRGNGDWKEERLEKFFSIGSSKRVLQEQWTHKGVPFYRTRELVSLSKGEPFGSEIFISEELYNVLSETHGVPSEGDFLVSGVGTLGVSYQVKAEDKFYFKDGNVLWFKLNEGLYSTYFKYSFQSDYIQKQIYGQTSKSTVGTYTIQNAKKTKLWYPPTISEQKKIANCFSSLDDLISAQDKKLESLKAHKKGLMQKLFPAEGQTVPEWRFSEFNDSDEWEVKSLSSLCDMQAGKFVQASEIHEIRRNNMYPCYGGNGLRGYTSSFTHSGEYSLIGRQGALCGNITYVTGDFHATEHAVVAIEKHNVCAKWLYFLLIKLNLNQYSTGQAQPGLSVQALEKIGVYVPKLIAEQQKIADCLSTIDALITAQAEQIEALRVHKKGLMQGMFPSLEEVCE